MLQRKSFYIGPIETFYVMTFSLVLSQGMQKLCIAYMICFMYNFDKQISNFVWTKIYRDEKNISGLKNISPLKKKIAIASQVRNSMETKFSFSAFGSEKQKRTTSVRWRITEEPPHEFANVHGARPEWHNFSSS